MYRVIKFFTDLHDNDHPYNVGDSFPRDGIRVTKERLKELSGSENKQGTPLIEFVDEQEEPAVGVEAEPEEKASVKKKKASGK